MQLDIFEHSRDVMLRNDVLEALQRHDATAARAAWARFAAELPQDDTLPMLDMMVSELEARSDAAVADHAAAHAALRRFGNQLEPAAQRLLGAAAAAAWMAPLYRQLAQRCAALAFTPEWPEVHSAALWLRCGEWAAAAEAVSRIESWRRIPAPLTWMAEARWRQDGIDAHWGLLAELAWLAPERFDALTRRLADPVLDRLRRGFDAHFEGDGNGHDLAWFPAWVLCDKPALAAALGQAQPGLNSPPECAMRLLLDLLHLERQGRQRDLVEQRKRLRGLQPSLYAAYMAAR